MKIAFLTTLDPEDTNTWSGTSYHILQALCKSHDVKIVGQNMLIQTVRFTKENIAPKRDIREYSPVFGKLCAEEVTGCDLVFFGDLYLSSFLDTNIPMVHLSDVTYHAFKDYMHNDSKPEEIRQTEDAERKLLNKYNTIIYSSEWAKQSAVSYYGIDPSKIHVVEFGANIPHPCDYQINIDTSVCNLVFIGRNWEKKGGDKALGTYRELKAMGMNCTLTIIGCQPPCAEDEGVVVYPFLDKSKPAHLSKLCSILRNAHFLILPTQFDAFGIVFCEASAYGVPSVAANVQGTGQPICEGRNGFLFPPTATAIDYAQKIHSIFCDKDKYIALRKSSRKEYETRLNWDVWAKKVNCILEQTVINYQKAHGKQ